MKNRIILLLINLSFISLFSQKNESNFAQQTFRNNYSKTIYPKYKKKIIKVDSISLLFDKKTLKIITANNDLRKIFELGIFNPDIVFGENTTKKISDEELNKMTQNERILFELTRNDLINIGNLKELKKINPNHKTKRFLFWRTKERTVNPTEYYFELYNESAKENYTLNKFLEKAEMTFFYKGTIIL